MTTVRKQIREGVKRPNGLVVSDIYGYQGTVGSAFCQLAKDGVIFAAKVSHRTVRYFDTPERAAAYLAITPKPQQKKKAGEKVGPRPGWGPDDPVHITSETRVTIAPTPPRALRTNTFPVY